ncbi:LysR family transcriptional regulator [Rhodococcus sp. ABRD24]|uniref:LysR substrate-binding domain-containing protein n=1 Tax=Rhodococcus sp. ABRD24 TaxID=2507582 RepID=UPI00103B202C|nr:LysR substrate-binding domain-containing protein [Rhodococcus sp. ABRD24]QBJ95999.1 LysR family transcriptional regulator [Rhodococcus sp. ABRD24]
MTLDLRKLNHLIAVAAEGSFTRAAARVHMSQQALSSSIRALEREVGVPLLRRDATGVTALPAGEALIEDARILQGVTRAALERARRIGRGEVEILRIGHTPAVTSEEIVALLQTVNARYPGFAVEAHQRFPHQLAADLASGLLDIGLCRGMAPARGLSRATVARHRLRLAVAASHRLAAQSSVEMTEIADETVIVWGEPGRSGYTDLLLEHCRQAGFQPSYLRNPIQGTPPITAVVGTDQVAFVTSPPGSVLNGSVKVLELQPPIHAPVHALWPTNVTHTMRALFLDILSETV